MELDMKKNDVEQCRICSGNLTSVFDFGRVPSTGSFPKTISLGAEVGELHILHCSHCGFGQLSQDFDEDQLFGPTYGYRSSLNSEMRKHLELKAQRLSEQVIGGQSLSVLDVGSNDGTFLSYFDSCGFDELVGCDPTIEFLDDLKYPAHAQLIPKLFTKSVIDTELKARRFNLVTAVAMFYDLPDPESFLRGIMSVLDENGLIHLELSYAGLMVERKAIDTICHEHSGYHSLRSLNVLFTKVGLTVIKFDLNEVNGGSVEVTLAHSSNTAMHPDSNFAAALESKLERSLVLAETWKNFISESLAEISKLEQFILSQSAKGKKFAALGASTKGNMLLYLLGETAGHIDAVGDINESKVGSFTPVGSIPIISEREVIDSNFDYLIVLPWHFRETFIKLRQSLESKTELIFPLASFEII